MTRWTRLGLTALVGLPLVCGLAQMPGGFGGGGRGFREAYPEEAGSDREWQIDSDLADDHFTFVRLRHNGDSDGGFTDYPRAERNFTRRLQELTSLEVNPVYINLEIEDPKLFQYPFAFMSDMREVTFTPEEAEALRKYLTNGGFIMADDQWGDRAWGYVADAMKEVFPDKEPVELDINHPIFNCVFKLDYLPQVPSHDAAKEWHDRGEEDKHYELKGFSFEDPEAMDTPRFRAWFDDHGRMMMLVCHNNDIADGWEEEDFNPWFFSKYSEKLCFPLGINIIFYALTH